MNRVPLFKVHMPKGLGDDIETILQSGQLANGNEVLAFEDKLKSFLNNDKILSTADVSSSLMLCLKLAGVKPLDEVITSPMACLATTCPIANLSARIQWCDVDPYTGNLDPFSLEKIISSKTKAILVYHWAGYPAEMSQICQIAAKYGVPVIEDAGEALGAQLQGQRIGGGQSDFTVFSFYPNRHITTIEGAAIAFGSNKLFEQGRWMRRYGIHTPTFRNPDGEINPKSDIFNAGLNTYLNQVNALIGSRQMEYLPWILEKHQENGAYYSQHLSGLEGIECLHVQNDSIPAYWVYTLLAKKRDSLLAHLKACGIGASKIHCRNDRYSCFPGADSVLPGVDQFSEHAISIPCGWWVTPEDRAWIVEEIRDVIQSE